MEIQTEKKDQIFIIKPIIKTIDAVNSMAFKSEMISLIDRPQSMAIDLSEVEFIDSSGLSSLISIYKAIGIQDHCAIFGINPSVQQIFGYTGLDRIWKIANTRQEALEYLNEKTDIAAPQK